LKGWMAFIIHVVQQAHCFPKVGIFAAQLGKMLHRVSDGIAMFPQTLGLDPIMQNIYSSSRESFSRHLIFGCRTCITFGSWVLEEYFPPRFLKKTALLLSRKRERKERRAETNEPRY